MNIDGDEAPGPPAVRADDPAVASAPRMSSFPATTAASAINRTLRGWKKKQQGN